MSVTVRRVDPSEPLAERLGELLADCVAAGASVNFLLPYTAADGAAFFHDVLASAARGERVLLVAEDPPEGIVGTVQVVFAPQPNQPHRAEVAKMLVQPTARRRGVGARLLAAAEHAALGAGRTLLVLDTASPEAARLYERAGWERVGSIHGYSLSPTGELETATIFSKHL